MKTIAGLIIRRIRGKKRGWVFTPKNFIDIAPRTSIDVALHRLTAKGIIRKLGRGIYDFPITHPKLGLLAPNPDLIASAIASRTGDNVQPSAARAANQLGIDNQVPAKPTYLSSRTYTKRTIANFPIVIRHSKYNNNDKLSPVNADIINAIRHLGKDNIPTSTINQLRRILSNKNRLQLLKFITKFPDWMAPIIIELTRKKNG